MGLFKTNVDIGINLHEQPPYSKYTPQTPIKGTARVQFNENLKNVTGVVCGLTGRASIVDVVSDKPTGGSATKKLLKQGTFLQVSKVIPLDGIEGKGTEEQLVIPTTVLKNKIVQSDFNFQLPPDLYLPSSNTYRVDKIEIIIEYEIFVEVHRKNRLFKEPKVYVDLTQPLVFQGGQDPRVMKNDLPVKYVVTEVFKNKLKKFYYDEFTDALIPTSIDKSHNKTKFLRKLWNDNYKDEKYSLFTKSLPLTLDFYAPTSFDLSKPLITQIALILSCDLRSAGLESNQSKDFVFNGQSTGLGYFRIESLRITQQSTISVNQGPRTASHHESKPLVKINFADLICDVKDFTYNKETEAFETEINGTLLQETSNIDLNESLSTLLGDQVILSSGRVDVVAENDYDQLPASYSTAAQFDFTWKISDFGSLTQKFLFETKCTPDFMP